MKILSQKTNPYAEKWLNFSSATRDHQLTIYHDQGVYRHMRMGSPDSSTWSWTVITWPGSLAIQGDIGHEGIFTRLEDMFEFFDVRPSYYSDGSPSISPEYWSEKLSGGARSVREFSLKKFAQSFTQEVMESNRVRFGVLGHTKDEILWEPHNRYCDEEEARRMAEYAEVLLDDWEDHTHDFRHQFILTCYAVVATIQEYREHKMKDLS